MKILLVLAHPQQQGSFNHSLKQVAERTLSDVTISDLYRMDFKAVADWNDFRGSRFPFQYAAAQKEAFSRRAFSEDIEKEQQKVLASDCLILQFPLWWFSVPAILKGWFDRVLAKGFAYDRQKWFDEGLLRGKKAKLVLTTQSGESSYHSDGVHGPIDLFLKPIHHTLRLVGFEIAPPFVCYGVDEAPEDLKNMYLAKYEKELIDLQSIQ